MCLIFWAAEFLGHSIQTVVGIKTVTKVLLKSHSKYKLFFYACTAPQEAQFLLTNEGSYYCNTIDFNKIMFSGQYFVLRNSMYY